MLKKDKILAILSSTPFIVMYFLFALAPIIWIVINGFRLEDSGFSLDNFKEIFDSPFYLQSFRISISISFWSSLVGIVVAFICCYSLHTLLPSRIANAIVAFNSTLMNFSGVPLAFAFVVLIGTNGMINLIARAMGVGDLAETDSQIGILVIYIYFQIPLAILLLLPAFKMLREEYQQAAFLFGANRLDYWFRIVIPILFPALLGTFIILFANALGAYATVYALNPSFNIVPLRIVSLISGDVFMNPNLASALAMILMLIMVIITVVQRMLTKYYSRGIM